MTSSVIIDSASSNVVVPSPPDGDMSCVFLHVFFVHEGCGGRNAVVDEEAMIAATVAVTKHKLFMVTVCYISGNKVWRRRRGVSELFESSR